MNTYFYGRRGNTSSRSRIINIARTVKIEKSPYANLHIAIDTLRLSTKPWEKKSSRFARARTLRAREGGTLKFYYRSYAENARAKCSRQIFIVRVFNFYTTVSGVARARSGIAIFAKRETRGAVMVTRRNNFGRGVRARACDRIS